ncbi:MAG TPA: beta-ketoacyl-ACP synthase III [Candidatus Acidoferrales bacterium]|nr:beta-ketoacyl-ACP synthase III [Candidatus Acidoferrales bacterium]
MTAYGAAITGVGFCAPPGVLTNEDLEKLVDTSDEWITQRTGMKRRHIIWPEGATSDLAVPAGKAALEAAQRTAADIDCIICATATPDYPFPALACLVAAQLGVQRTPAFDISIACSGFVYSLTTAASLIRSGVFRSVLVIGAETLSKITDYTDRATCVLFGDGAGAAVVERADPDCFLGADLGADGSDPSVLYLPGGGSRNPYNKNGELTDERLGYIKMQGQSVFKFAVNQMAASTRLALERANLTTADIDFVVPHQANQRIVDAMIKMLGVPPEKCIVNIAEYGNTSAASIPIALGEAVEKGLIKQGHVVALVAFGGGLSWGSIVWRWSGAPVVRAVVKRPSAATPAGSP